jgi:hypothetical protein
MKLHKNNKSVQLLRACRISLTKHPYSTEKTALNRICEIDNNIYLLTHVRVLSRIFDRATNFLSFQPDIALFLAYLC